MNILLINHYAGSPQHGMVYRHYYLAREWVSLGHNVMIVAADRSHLRSRHPELGGRDKWAETINGIQYHWLKTPVYHKNGIKRFYNIATFVTRLYRESKNLAQLFNPDIVIASSSYNMEIWPAHRIARLANAKLVYEVRDLWPLTPIALSSMSKWHPFIFLVQAAEDYAYRHSDVVVSVLPCVREYMESRGMVPHKLNIVPNGVDPIEWLIEPSPLDDSLRNLLDKLKNQGFYIVGFSGGHGLANALDTLLDAAVLMKASNVAFVLVGSGLKKAALQQRAAAEGLKNVWFIDPIKKAQIPALLRWFDVAYIGLQKQPLFRFGIAPNKLMDYMMAERPVLMAIEAGNDPVTEAGCGLTVEPENPQAIANGLRHMLALSEEERRRMGERGKLYILKNHTYPVLAQQFLDAIKK